MPRISDRRIVVGFLAGSLALLASCASPEPTAHVQERADRCSEYESPFEFGRCLLLTSANGWQFIPENGRNADLDTQIRCAPLRPDPEAYVYCISRAAGSQEFASPHAGTVQPPPDLASRGPIRVELIAPDVAVARAIPAPGSRSSEELDAALSTSPQPRIEPAVPVARIAPGQHVAAPVDGKVVFAGTFKRYGWLLILEHEREYHTLLWGFARLDVKRGDQVHVGQIVGIMDARDDDPPVLHVERRRNGRPIDLAASSNGIQG